ncbi:UDP-glucuronosyltransferase 2C1-like [Lytechinus pictus]|uniref:UDP-glucuronosyltransferase 2C1-like n=1 Tax=Lytechinus pictus TaxID=7653 RepID=UPI0030B9C448
MELFICFAKHIYLVWLTSLVLLGRTGDAANILMNAILGKGSHYYITEAIGEQLVNRGHNVTHLVSNAFYKQASSRQNSELFNYEVYDTAIPPEVIYQLYANMSRVAFLSPLNSQHIEVESKPHWHRYQDCQAVLDNHDLLERIRRANYSLIIYDMLWPCLPIISKMLDIPLVGIISFPNPCMETEIAGSNFNPSYVPCTGIGFTNKMTFVQRFVNTFLYAFVPWLTTDKYVWYNQLLHEHYSNDSVQLLDIVRGTQLFLANSDFVADYPCALGPNVVLVGGLTSKPPQKLPPSLENFVSSSGDHGVIVCTFGSFLSSHDLFEANSKLSVFISAFARLPQKVIMQLSHEPSFPLPGNVKVLPWLPQNDLLGHPKTKAFVFPGGNNGFYEAIYHGVPTVVIPLRGDQFDVAARVTSTGIGVVVDKLTVTEESLQHAIHQVTSTNKFAKKAKKLSTIFRDRPMPPAQRAAFWIDHVIKHGGEYLQSSVHDLSRMQHILLDVLTVMFILFLVLCVLAYKCSSKVLWFLYRCVTHKHLKDS